jgi:3-deoxy-D-manno-octulosonic-acid transferase
MGFSPSFILYNLLGPVRSRRAVRASSPDLWQKRPPGLLVWVHCERTGDLQIIRELISRLSDCDPNLWFLLTTTGEIPATLPDQSFHQTIPADTRHAACNFLLHWHPDVAVWVSGRLMPVLIQQTAERDIPLYLLDTGAAIDTTRGWRLLPGLARRTLSRFNACLSGDEATSLALIGAGARSDRVHTTGVLEMGVSALPCNQAEWDVLAAQLATRPIWLAAQIDFTELESVLAAHGQAMRRSHRLLLIVTPADPDAGDAFAEVLRQKDFIFSQRSAGDEPEAETQVYLADTEDEMGLWYRLAPVTFIGQTLSGLAGTCPDPFDAAALGSVVLHGPAIDPHAVAYQRLARAGASRQITHLGELALSLEALLAPDRAAIMAHAAWQISSAGALAMEKAVEIICEALPPPAAEPE